MCKVREKERETERKKERERILGKVPPFQSVGQ
jgi:hypothetical protein